MNIWDWLGFACAFFGMLAVVWWLLCMVATADDWHGVSQEDDDWR